MMLKHKTFHSLILQFLKKVKNISPDLLDPRSTWNSSEEWNIKATELAKLFINNFKKFCDNDHGKKLLIAGPQL